MQEKQLPVSDSFVAIEQLLSRYRDVIGKDYQKYYNHVCRVVGNCLLMDTTTTNTHKYIVAGVFHDIGIWTNHTIDYLEPSVTAAIMYLNESSQEDLVPEVSAMITWHHKTISYKGRFSDTVNTFRKADWIDVSLGIFAFDADRKSIAANRRRFANEGFHLFLIGKLANNFIRHPLSPLPMFRL